MHPFEDACRKCDVINSPIQMVKPPDTRATILECLDRGAIIDNRHIGMPGNMGKLEWADDPAGPWRTKCYGTRGAGRYIRRRTNAVLRKRTN